jgi:hypothetical protein
MNGVSIAARVLAEAGVFQESRHSKTSVTHSRRTPLHTQVYHGRWTGLCLAATGKETPTSPAGTSRCAFR